MLFCAGTIPFALSKSQFNVIKKAALKCRFFYNVERFKACFIFHHFPDIVLGILSLA